MSSRVVVNPALPHRVPWSGKLADGVSAQVYLQPSATDRLDIDRPQIVVTNISLPPTQVKLATKQGSRALPDTLLKSRLRRLWSSARQRLRQEEAVGDEKSHP